MGVRARAILRLTLRNASDRIARGSGSAVPCGHRDRRRPRLLGVRHMMPASCHQESSVPDPLSSAARAPPATRLVAPAAPHSFAPPPGGAPAIETATPSRAAISGFNPATTPLEENH